MTGDKDVSRAHAIERLYDGIKKLDPTRFPRTAALLSSGEGRIAQKVGEEAIEVVIEMTKKHRSGVVRESADLLYHLVVLWAAMGISPQQVWEEMESRERNMGMAEKLPKVR